MEFMDGEQEAELKKTIRAINEKRQSANYWSKNLRGKIEQDEMRHNVSLIFEAIRWAREGQTNEDCPVGICDPPKCIHRLSPNYKEKAWAAVFIKYARHLSWCSDVLGEECPCGLNQLLGHAEKVAP